MNRYRTCASVVLLGAAALAAGCSPTDTSPPTSAHYKLTASKPVQLIISTEFSLSGTEAQLLEADTFTITSADTEVDLPQPPRIFVRAVALTPGTQISLVVDVGDKNWYDNTRTFAPPEKLEFVYGYSGSE